MIRINGTLLTIAIAILITSCSRSEDECVAEKGEIAVLNAILELHKSKFESRSAEASGYRATEEMRRLLEQRDENIRLAQEAEIQRLEEKLTGLRADLKLQSQAGDSTALAGKQAELDAALQEAQLLRSKLETYRDSERLVESRLKTQREVGSELLNDPVIFEPSSPPGGDGGEDSMEQDLVGMMMVAGVCYAASGGLCAMVAADFLQGILGGSVTEEDIQKMGSIIDKTSRGESLSDEEKAWVRGRTRDLFEGNENAQEILVDVIGGSKSVDKGFEELMTKVVSNKLGEENLQQLEGLIQGNVSCTEINELFKAVDINSRRNIQKVLPILKRKLEVENPDAASCLSTLMA